MSLFELPASGAVSAEDGPSRPWFPWFRKVTDTCNSLRQSGPTGQRPTANLWVGRPYFDTTLGYTVYYDGSTWVASGGGGGGGGGAPTNASYLTLGTDATLTAERVLTAGTGVTLTDAGAGSTLTVTNSLPARTVAATLAFGGSFTDKAETVVTGQTWVTANTRISAQVLTPSGTDPDEMYLLDLRPVVSSISVGNGWTITLYSPPEARGSYTVMCVGN